MMTPSAQLDVVYEALSGLKYTSVIDGLRPDSTFCFNPSKQPFLDIYMENPKEFVEILKLAIYRVIAQKRGNSKLPIIESAYKKLKIKIDTDNILKMHDISSQHENSTVTFNCQIIAIDSPKTFIKTATFLCPMCSRDYPVKSNIDRKIQIPFCGNPQCRRAKTEVDPTTVVTDDVQTILMQEFMEDSKNNSPVILTGKLIGENIRTSFVGQRKQITGLFRSVVDLKNNENDVFIDIMCLDDLEEQKPIIPSESELSKLFDDVKKESFIDGLIGSFAPNIYGYKDIKLAILLELVGGVKTKKRGDINTLLVGDPSMAKSELLKFAKDITQRSIYTSGRGSSAAGLTIGMVKMPDGRFVAQAGVLRICNNGFAFIDEFESAMG